MSNRDIDRTRHSYAIETLSKDLNVSVEVMSELYNKKLNEIEKTARIKDFLVLVVMHDVRETVMEEVVSK